MGEEKGKLFRDHMPFRPWISTIPISAPLKGLDDLEDSNSKIFGTGVQVFFPCRLERL